MYWFVSNLTALDRGRASWIVGAMISGLVVVVFGAARQVMAPRRASLVALFALVTPLAIEPSVYLATGAQTILGSLLVTAGFGLLIAAARRDRLDLAALAALCVGVSFFFYESMTFYAFAVPVFALLAVGNSSIASELKSRRRVYSTFGAAMAAGLSIYVALYLAGSYSSGGPAASNLRTISGGPRFLVQLFLPLLGGGPIRWTPGLPGYPISGTTTDVIVLMATASVAVVMLGLSLRHSAGRSATAVLLLFALAQGCLITRTRYWFYGEELYRTPKYVAALLPAVLMWLAVVLAERPGREVAGSARRPRVSRVLPIAIAASLILGGISDTVYVERWQNSRLTRQARAFVAESVESIDRLPADALLLDSQLPAYFQYVEPPYATAAGVLAPTGRSARFLAGSGESTVALDDHGIAVPAHLVGREQWDAPGGECDRSAALPNEPKVRDPRPPARILVQPGGRTPQPRGPLTTLRITLEASHAGSGALIVGIGNLRVDLRVPVAGRAEIWFQGGSITPVRLERLPGVCIVALSGGVLARSRK